MTCVTFLFLILSPVELHCIATCFFSLLNGYEEWTLKESCFPGMLVRRWNTLSQCPVSSVAPCHGVPRGWEPTFTADWSWPIPQFLRYHRWRDEIPVSVGAAVRMVVGHCHWHSHSSLVSRQTGSHMNTHTCTQINTHPHAHTHTHRGLQTPRAWRDTWPHLSAEQAARRSGERECPWSLGVYFTLARVDTHTVA